MAEATAPSASSASSTHLARAASRVTVAHALLAAIVGAAALLRLTDLGSVPLSAEEASSALAVYAFWQPDAVVPSGVSPAYFTLTALLTPLLGYSDGVMRLVPALFGVALVALPWLLRDRLGTVGALVVSALLTVSPVLAILSRTAGGDASALFAALLLLIALIHYTKTRAVAWLTAAAITVAVGSASSPLFYTAVLTWGVAWILHQAVGLGETATTSPVEREQTRRDRRRALLAGAGVFAALSTAFLLRPAGLGDAAAQFAAWVTGFSLSAESGTLLTPLLAVTRYQLGLLVVGGIALIWSALRGDRTGLFMFAWLLAAVPLVLLQRGQVTGAAVLLLPLALAVGSLCRTWFAVPTSWEKWLVGGGTLLFSLLILVNLGRFLRSTTNTTSTVSFFFILAFGLLLMAALVLLIINLSNDAYVLVQGLLLGVVALICYTGWGTAWWLTHEAANDVRERWVVTATHDDMQRFREIVRQVSAETSGAPTDLTVISSVDTPALRWALRDMRDATFAPGLPPAAAADAAITPLDAAEPFDGAAISMPFTLSETRVDPVALPELSEVEALLRWWFFRDGAAAGERDQFLLWVRSTE